MARLGIGGPPQRHRLLKGRVCLKLPAGQHLNLVLATQGNLLPRMDRGPMNPQRSSQCRLGSVVVDGVLLGHDGYSKTCLTRTVKHDQPRNAYAWPMPDNNSINARIKARIEEMGMQQVELAKRVGVSKTAVSLWINETTKFIRPDHLVKIADALGLEIRYLITGQGPRLAKHDPPMDFDNQDMELLRAPPEVKAIFRAILSTSHKQT